MASWSFKSSRSYRANVISQIVKMAHCQLFQKMSVCTNAFAFQKCKLRYLGQSSEWVNCLCQQRVKTMIKTGISMTIPNTLKYLITNPAKACTAAIQTNHPLNTSWKVVTYSMIQRVYSDYDFIVLIFVCFFFSFTRIVINGIFNFLACESGWTGQRA